MGNAALRVGPRLREVMHAESREKAKAPRVKMSWYQRSSNYNVRGEREKLAPVGDQD